MLDTKQLTHLKQLEAESIHIIREVVAEFDNPVMMYSVGKDSAVMLHLALKAFAPAKLPFPLFLTSSMGHPKSFDISFSMIFNKNFCSSSICNNIFSFTFESGSIISSW